MKILIVEDNKELSQSMSAYLQSEGFLCEVAMDFDTADEKTDLYSYDCILIDISLPGGSGLELLKKMKKKRTTSGIIIISDKCSEYESVLDQEAGRIDSLSKPFQLCELSERIKALFRTINVEGKNEIQSEELNIDPADLLEN